MVFTCDVQPCVYHVQGSIGHTKGLGLHFRFFIYTKLTDWQQNSCGVLMKCAEKWNFYQYFTDGKIVTLFSVPTGLCSIYYKQYKVVCFIFMTTSISFLFVIGVELFFDILWP